MTLIFIFTACASVLAICHQHDGVNITFHPVILSKDVI